MRKSFILITNLILLICFITKFSYARKYEYEIAILQTSDAKAYKSAINAFKGTLRSMGYEEARNTRTGTYDMRKKDKLNGYAQEIRELPATFIFAVGSSAFKFAAKEFDNIPVIFALTRDYDKISKTNFTGVVMEIPVDVQLSYIKKTFKDKNRIGLIYSNDTPMVFIREAQTVCDRQNLILRAQQVQAETDIPSNLQAISDEIDVLWLIPDVNVGNKRTPEGKETLKFIYRYTLKHNIPVVGFTSKHVEEGCLLSLTLDYESIGKQAAYIADKIAKGVSPSSIPFESPAPYIELNMRTAKLLGIEIPETIVSVSKILVK